MEKRLKTPDLFKFPFFEAICWFVAKNLLETLKGNACFVLRDAHTFAHIILFLLSDNGPWHQFFSPGLFISFKIFEYPLIAFTLSK